MPLVALAVTAGSSIASSLIGKHSAKKAAEIQANATKEAAAQSNAATEKSVKLQRDMYDQNFSEAVPWMDAGQKALKSMQDLLPGGSAAPGAYKAFDSGMEDYKAFDSGMTPYKAFDSGMTPYKAFQAPTTVDESNDPGFEARMAAGEKALNRSAAVKGRLYSGQTLKELTQFGQDYMSNEYSKVYDRAQSEYGIGYQQHENEYNKKLGEYNIGYQENENEYNKKLGEYGVGYQQNQDKYNKRLGEYQMGYNQQQQKQADEWSRLSGVAGQGQLTLGQLLNAGQANANSQSNLIMRNSDSQTGFISDRANVGAAAAVAGGNAASDIIGTGGKTLSTILGLLQARKDARAGQTNP